MKNKLSAIPHFFTFSNVFLGFLAIIFISQERFTSGAWLIVVGTLFDMLDGKLARLTKTYSKFGIELDSLADVITFGVAPAYLVYRSNFITAGPLGIALSFVFLLAGVFRLARFNTTLKGYAKKDFIGLPIPVAALAVSTFIIFSQRLWNTVEIQHAFLILVPLLSLLMASHIEYETIPRIMFKRSIRKNAKPLVYIVGFLCVLLYPREAFFPGTILYILAGVLDHCVSVIRSRRETDEIVIDDIEEERIVK